MYNDISVLAAYNCTAMVRKGIIALLVVASLATAGLYIFSFSGPRKKFYPTPAYQLSVKDGKLFVGRIFQVKHPKPTEQGPSVQTLLGFTFMRSVTQGRGVSLVAIPLWVAFVLFAFYPTIVVPLRRSRRRAYRRSRGLCLKCGYNLAGNESGRCPECGTGIDRGARQGGKSAEPMA